MYSTCSFLVQTCDLFLQTREQVASTSVPLYLYSTWNQYDQQKDLKKRCLSRWNKSSPTLLNDSVSEENLCFIGPKYVSFRFYEQNKKVANFHKSMVTTPNVHTVFYGTALYIFVGLVWKPLESFHSHFASKCFRWSAMM